MGLFGGDSKSTTNSTTVIDDSDIAASDNAIVDAKRFHLAVKQGGQLRDSTFVFGSDEVANNAIDFAGDAIKTNADFFEKSFTDLLKSSDSRVASAEANLAATRNFAGEIIEKGQESADDRLIKLVAIMGGLAVIAVLFQSGTLKGVFR